MTETPIQPAARFFLVSGLMAWGGERMEAALHRYIDRMGWATVALWWPARSSTRGDELDPALRQGSKIKPCIMWKIYGYSWGSMLYVSFMG